MHRSSEQKILDNTATDVVRDTNFEGIPTLQLCYNMSHTRRHHCGPNFEIGNSNLLLGFFLASRVDIFAARGGFWCGLVNGIALASAKLV